MAEFQTRSGGPLGGKIVAVKGNRIPLKLIPARGEKIADAIVADHPMVAEVVDIEHRARANFSTFSVSARLKGSAALTASAGGKRVAGPVMIEVIDALALPAANTDAGALARLLLAETRSPLGKAEYSAAGAIESMTLMRVVVENRKAKPSGRWGSAGAVSIADVVKSQNPSLQFKGFGGYPSLSAEVSRVIDGLIEIANNGADPRMSKARAHVQSALNIASGPRPGDPTQTGLYWWRTADSGAAGNDIKLYKTLMGNSFYREGK